MVYREKTQRENQIDAIKFTISQIEQHGDSVLNNIDKGKGKGKDWALKELREQLNYLESKNAK